MTESSIDDFAKAIGSALLEWGRVELHHCHLFQLCATGHTDNTPLFAAYWAIVSFEGRQKMVDAALRQAFGGHPEYLKVWTNLNNRLIGKNKKRNSLAHSQILSRLTSDQAYVHFLVPYFWKDVEEKFADDFPSAMRVTDVNGIAESFRRLQEDIQSFSEMFYTEQIVLASPKLSDGKPVIPRYRLPTHQPLARRELPDQSPQE